MATTECPFCRKLAILHQIPDADIVGRFPQSVAFLGEWQYYHGYCVLVSRKHATELSQLTDEERLGFLDEMCLLACVIEECFRPLKLNYELLGNQVPHLHWHVIPRYADDPDRLDPIWLALERAKNDKNERRRLRTGIMEREATLEVLRGKFRAMGIS